MVAVQPHDRPGCVVGHATVLSPVFVDWTGVEMRIGRVHELYRYPVKSMLGERLSAVDVDERGLQYDRMWATRTARGKLGSGKSTKRFHRIDGLTSAAARCEAGIPIITLPDGTQRRGDDPLVDGWLSSAFGRPVTLHRENTQTHFDDGPVHLITTASLRSVQQASGVSVDPRRLRPNVLLSDTAPADFPEAEFPEDEWLGCYLQLGEQVVLEIVGLMQRCVMVNNPVGELPGDNQVLKAITTAHDMTLGVFANVVRGGRVAVGDQVISYPRPSSAT